MYVTFPNLSVKIRTIKKVHYRYVKMIPRIGEFI